MKKYVNLVYKSYKRNKTGNLEINIDEKMVPNGKNLDFEQNNTRSASSKNQNLDLIPKFSYWTK